MTASHLENTWKRLPDDWRSYLRMRSGGWEREINQNKNFSTDHVCDLKSRKTFLPELYTGIGKPSFNFYPRANEFKPEPRYKTTKSAFSAWISSTQQNPSPKRMSTNARTSYSPIRNRYSTRFLPLRSHLDTRNNLDQLLQTNKCMPTNKRVMVDKDPQFEWAKPYAEQLSDGARTAAPCLKKSHSSASDMCLSEKARGVEVGSGESQDIRREDKLDQNRSADRSKSPRKQWHVPQVIDKFWWETPRKPGFTPRNTERTLPRGPADTGHGESKTNRSSVYQRFNRSSSVLGCVTRDVANRNGLSENKNNAKNLQKDYKESRSKQPDARTVEIKRQLMAAREKIQQKEMGFNLRIAQPVKQSVEKVKKELKKKDLVPYEPLRQKGSGSKSEPVYCSPRPRNNERYDNMFTRTPLNFSNNLFEDFTHAKKETSARLEANAEGDQIHKVDSKVAISLDRTLQSPVIGKVERRCKSAVPATKTNIKSSSATKSSKIGTKHKVKPRHRATPRDLSFNGSKITTSKDRDHRKQDRPHSAANLSSTITFATKSKEKNVYRSKVEPVAQKQQKRTASEERMEGPNVTSECASLVSRGIISPKRTHSLDLQKLHQSNTSTICNGEQTPRDDTLFSAPLQKLAAARKKLRELLDAEEPIQCRCTKPVASTTQEEGVFAPPYGHMEGGLFPPQHHFDRFFYTDNAPVTYNLDDKNQPLKNDDLSHAKNSPEKENRVKPEPLTSKPAGLLERFPKKKAQAALIHKPFAVHLKQDRGPEAKDSIKGSVSDELVKCKYKPITAQNKMLDPNKPGTQGIYLSGSSDNKASQQNTHDAKKPAKIQSASKQFVKALDALKTPHAGTNGVEASKSLGPEPPARAGANKKKGARRKKKGTGAQETKTSVAGKRGGRNTSQLPKTYHQAGLAPLVRSPSSENTFQFAVDLESMQVESRPKRCRRKRRTKRCSN